MQLALFAFFAVIAIGSAIMVIAGHNVLYSALFLILNLFSIAAVYILLKAEFLAGVQVLVYAGAIMVLFLFVVLLINIEEVRFVKPFHKLRVIPSLLTVLLALEIIYLLKESFLVPEIKAGALQAVSLAGTTELIGQKLFTDYLFPFEVASLLLLAAMIGAIIFARPEKEDKSRDLS